MSAGNEFAEAFERLLRDACTPSVVRTIESEAPGSAGTHSSALWAQLEASGFLAAMMPESTGGADLPLRETYDLIEACGRYAMPLPFADTMLARALLASAQNLPAEITHAPIALAQAQFHRNSGEPIATRFAPYARTGQFVLVELDRAKIHLLACERAERALLAPHACAGELRWPAAMLGDPVAVPAAMLPMQAALLAAQLAGAMQRVLDLTIEYANQRVQFGKPIAKFQAVQHQISVMAEQVFLARMAARMGFDSHSCAPNPRRAAIAKAVTSEAAAKVAAIGHALHGAIGMTAEYDLQLFTRRLHEWRLCAGAESYWQRELGAQLIDSGVPVLEFVLRA